ncbi:hypothetical protein FGU65_09315 [Methanoculleus sp. FWC-SCC1]|uniref:Uncharacterized protein n=1 Tax=Methanoculleus frigidifontis TaxID=2584085 RepID=A0ABT8MAW8_9EURY|nr:hypothetical protein [Methanoculleus sp. FWC-SCC1]MDN7025083.1 hypothetical protein [Methanoculleus sp. FWC-SCC1]
MHSTILLKIKAHDADGNLIHEECKENDLFLWGWGVLIAQMFKVAFQYTDPTVFEYFDINGTVRNTVSSGHYGYNVLPWANTARVQVGSGQGAPSISNYQLEQYVAEVIPNIPDVIVSGDIVKVLFSATFAFQSETVCAETGVKMGDVLNDGVFFLITRDTFTPVTVSAGGSLSLQYELWFNGTPT